MNGQSVICKHGYPDQNCCPRCEIDRLTTQLAEAKTANQSMHGMILEIRKHFNAWDTPNAPAEKDIVDCIISSHNKQLAEREQFNKELYSNFAVF